MQNYGIDWEENAGEQETDLVEVPETTTGLSEAQINAIITHMPENVTINNAVDVFINILNVTTAYYTGNE